MQSWVELFLRIELQLKWKDGNGDHLGKHWTRRTERRLMKCFPFQECIMLQVRRLVDLS
jgi:hypothetical protein